MSNLKELKKEHKKIENIIRKATKKRLMIELLILGKI